MKNKYNIMYLITTIVLVILVTLVIIGAINFGGGEDNVIPKVKVEKTETEVNKEICEKNLKNIPTIFQELGFAEEDSFWYIKGDYRQSSKSGINLNKSNYKKEDNKEIYDIVTHFAKVDEELFMTLINSLPEKSALGDTYNRVEINKDGYRLSLEYNSTGHTMWTVLDCSWYRTDSYSYDFYSVDNLDNQIKFIKKYFDKDIPYVELIKHMINESKYNHSYEDSRIVFRDVEISYSISLNELSFVFDNTYNPKNIKYEVTRNIDNYKELLKKDLTLIDKYFNERISNEYESIIKTIEEKEYLKGRKIDGLEDTGSYYTYTKHLNGCSITFDVFEDKIRFKYNFTE